MAATREEIDRLIADGAPTGARAALAALWHEQPTPAVASFVVSRFERLQAGGMKLQPFKVAILRSFTVEPIVPLLRALGFVAGLNLIVRIGEFNAYTQEILTSGNWLDEFSANLTILAVQARDIVPDLFERYADLSQEAVANHVQQATDAYRQILTAARARLGGHILVHSLELPDTAIGSADAVVETRQREAIQRINLAIGDIAKSARDVYVLDYDALIAERGRTAWHDERKWIMARMPIAAGEMIHLARQWMRFIHPMSGRICKALVVDLDNTLWGGVIGEDGIQGIRLDDSFPGAAFRNVQREMLSLHRRGILLAVCSKNNPADAMEAIQNHPGMILRPEHFACLKINWLDKAENLRAIASELNIGIDSLAFVDDNPVEREWVREQAPEVTVIDLPDDPLGFASAVQKAPVFERLSLTDEDRSRAAMYAEQRMRLELSQSATSVEDFYRSLQMRAAIEPVNDKTLARAVQLTQKTNQFNLTTRRYTEQQLSAALSAKVSRGYTISVRDRFGDNGIVGLALICLNGAVCEIDTFLLSCRVIGRTVETALLAHLAEEASRAGASKVSGWFVPNKKNAPAADFYSKHGFSLVQEKDGAARWELDLGCGQIAWPEWIACERGSADER